MFWGISTCRICSNTDNTCFLIYGKEEKSTISEKIKKCLPIQISKADFKPKSLCLSCLAKLNDFHSFIELCLLSDNKFNSLLWESRSERVLDDIDIVIEGNDKLPPIVPFKNVAHVPKNAQQHACNNNQNPTVLRHSTDYRDQNQLVECPLPCARDQILNANVYTPLTNPQEDSKGTNGPKTPIVVANSEEIACRARFSCTVCGKSFARRTGLKDHVAKHFPVKPYQCKSCGKSFALQKDLACHRKLHMRTHACEVCAKSFTCPSKLIRHHRTHTGYKPFVCGIADCRKRFADKRNLIDHQVSHSNVRRFACSTCAKPFKMKKHLRDHQRVHGGDGAVFECDTCGKRYRWKSNLVGHIKKHNYLKCMQFDRDCIRHRKECSKT